MGPNVSLRTAGETYRHKVGGKTNGSRAQGNAERSDMMIKY